MTPKKLIHKQTHQKPWAQKCPRVSMKTIFTRPLAAIKLNKPLSVTKTNKRPLVVSKHNKSLSATTGKRAKKLRRSKNKKLRKRHTRAQVLSKKVNKVISGLKKGQSKISFPRAKNTKVLRTQINLKIAKKITQTKKTCKSLEHKSALGHPQQEYQVTSTNTLMKITILRKNSKRYAQTGAYKTQSNQISHSCPGP